MRFKDGMEPFRHPYGDCFLNVFINEFMQVGLSYYPLFAHRLNFEYIPKEGKRLGDSIEIPPFTKKHFQDIIYQLYGVECCFEDKGNDKKDFIKRVKKLLEKSSVPCLIDGYYDPSTEYANAYQKVHQGHGRIVTKMDSEYVYYYAINISDPAECFSISLDDFYLACEGIIFFRYHMVPRSKEERHSILQKMLSEWFVEKDYQKMLEDIGNFSEAVRSKFGLIGETADLFQHNKVPDSRLFHVLVLISRSRGATIAFLKGYMEEFGNNAYQVPIQCFERSLELWNIARALLVKYAITQKQSIQESMADCLLKIQNVEKKAIAMTERNICDEISIKFQTKS